VKMLLILLSVVPMFVFSKFHNKFHNMAIILYVCSPAQLCVGSTGVEDRPGNGHVCSAPPQMVVIDLRSYAVTLANRAKGGGSECVGEEHFTFLYGLLDHFCYFYAMILLHYVSTLYHCSI